MDVACMYKPSRLTADADHIARGSTAMHHDASNLSFRSCCEEVCTSFNPSTPIMNRAALRKGNEIKLIVKLLWYPPPPHFACEKGLTTL